MYMIADEERKKVAEQILKYGWIEATPENIKAYMDGFEMAKRKSFEETGITSEEYLKRLSENENHPIHIVTPRQIIEADIQNEISLGEIGNAEALVTNLVQKTQDKTEEHLAT